MFALRFIAEHGSTVLSAGSCVASRPRVILSRRNRGGGRVAGAVEGDEGSAAKDCSISSQPLSAESRAASRPRTLTRQARVLSDRSDGSVRLKGHGREPTQRSPPTRQ